MAENIKKTIGYLRVSTADQDLGKGGVKWNKKMKIHNYTVIFKPLDEGGHDVIVPAIPEIRTSGETREEAQRMLEDAILRASCNDEAVR